MYKAFSSTDESRGILQNDSTGSQVRIKDGCLAELKDRFFWRAVVCEFFASLTFVLCVTLVLTNINGEAPPLIVISFTVGLSVSVIIQIFDPLCGAHLNSAVTIGVFVKGGISCLKCFSYIVVQHVGAISGTAITYGLIPSNRHGNLGSLVLNSQLSVAQGFFIEMIFTMLLVFTALASTSDDNGRTNFGFSNALAIGFSITVAQFICVPLTGSGINPSRAVGSAAISGIFPEYFWIYWVAPFVGGIIVGLVYRFLLQPERKEAVKIQTLMGEGVLEDDSGL